jgi:hypothetical protein
VGPAHAATVDHFTLQVPGGGSLPANWTAGHPVTVSITAFSGPNPTDYAFTFNGVCDLTYLLDYDATFKTISPQTITFVNGQWTGSVTLYRADPAPGGYYFTVSYGGSGVTNSDFVHVYHDDNALHPYKYLIIAPGMTAQSGMAPEVWSSFDGAVGSPAIQTAGTSLTAITFFLCDNWWNKVTTTAYASDAITIHCTDGQAMLGGTPFVGGTRTVNLANGQYVASGSNALCLYTVDVFNGGQFIQLTGADGTQYSLGPSGPKGPVGVKHANQAVDAGRPRFNFSLSTANKTAGIPFAVTITALDAYGNTLDSSFGAAAFTSFAVVSLSSQTDVGGWSLWPYTVTNWIEGVVRPWVFLYKKASGSQYLTAAYDFGTGSKSGSSQAFSVLPNAFTRLVPILPGMSYPDNSGAGGIYTSPYPSSPPPANPAVFNNFGSPSSVNAGSPFSVQAYSCDPYGNVCKYSGDFITLTSSDRFVPMPPVTALNPSLGYALFSGFQFHTRGSSSVTAADATITTMTAGTTPLATVNHGAFYGLQILAPGLVAVEGSGNTNVTGIAPVPDGAWYSGVTATNVSMTLPYQGDAQIAGYFFSVTVQAADLYGNYVGTCPSDQIRLTSDGAGVLSVPQGATTPLYGYLNVSGAAKVFFSCRFDSYDTGLKGLFPEDLTNGSIQGYLASHSSALQQIVQSTETTFKVIVNGVTPESGLPVDVNLAPGTFTVQVEIRYVATGEIVNSNRAFILEPFLDRGSTPTPALGSLGIGFGTTLFGVAVISGETYDRADTIYIRVRDAGGSGSPYPAFSTDVHVGGGFTPTTTPTVSVTATPSPSITPTPTISATVTNTPTITSSWTSTRTFTVTPTSTITPTITPTPSITRTFTHSPTSTVTPTITPTPTVTRTSTITPTFTVTPTISRTTIITPTATATPTGAPISLAANDLLAYPQPAHDRLHLVYVFQGPGQVSVGFFNAAGERVLHLTEVPQVDHGRGTTLIRTDALSSGIYFVLLNAKDASGERWLKKRIVVLH